jgi:hypothetical protein
MEELHIEHLVIFERENATFAAARESGNHHLRIFLVYSTTGCVYTRNGRADTWEELLGSQRDSILARILAAKNYRTVPTYKINGSLN